jgi:hypothetical protein
MKYAYLYPIYIRWSLLSIVKHTKCEINDFSIVFSAKIVSWTSFTLRFYQLCGAFLQVIRWQFSRWLRLKIASGRVERDRGPVLTNHHFVPGPVVGSRRPWIYFDSRKPLICHLRETYLQPRSCFVIHTGIKVSPVRLSVTWYRLWYPLPPVTLRDSWSNPPPPPLHPRASKCPYKASKDRGGGHRVPKFPSLIFHWTF